jgi:hypothetical protein
MSFDFHTLYAGHTNAQLLAIVLQKDLHDELAVQAAEDILKTREVTEEDKTAAEAVALERAQREQQLIEQKAAIANRIREIFFPMGKPITWFLKAFSVGVLLFWLFELLGWLFGLYRRSVYFDLTFSNSLVVGRRSF